MEKNVYLIPEKTAQSHRDKNIEKNIKFKIKAKENICRNGLYEIFSAVFTES